MRAADKNRIFVLVAVAMLFAAVLAAKAMSRGPSSEVGEGASAGVQAGAEVRYRRALSGPLPIYILFHSETCVPCVEIDKVADEVVPEYEGRIAFVDALTDDPGTRALAEAFPFQYIPTSFFLDAEGRVVDQHTGVLSAGEMRERLDGLLE